MASAAAASKPPANTESWRSIARPIGLSRFSLQAIVARSVCWRSGSSGSPRVKIVNGLESRFQERRGGEHLEPQRGKLERQRQSLERGTDPGDIRRVGLRQREAGIGSRGRCTSSLYRLVPASSRERGAAAMRSGIWQRRHRQDMLALYSQRRSGSSPGS